MIDWMVKLLGQCESGKHGKHKKMELTVIIGLVLSYLSLVECSGHRRQPHIILVVLRDLVSKNLL